MPSRSLEADKVFEELMQEFPPEIEAMAREFKAFTRERKIKTVAQLLRIVLLYCGLDKSTRDIAGNVTLTIEKISDTAIRKRLIAANAWVKAILPKMINIPKVDSNRRIIIVDGSCVESPGAKGIDYRIHIALNLLTLEIVEIMVGDRSVSESLMNYHFQAGDIVIGDRAYGQYRQKLIDVREQKCDFLLRYHAKLPLINTQTTQPLDLMQQLNNHAVAGQYSVAVQIKTERDDRVINGWLHAFRLPPEAQAKRLRRIKARAKKEHRNTEAITLFLAGWLVIFTTLSPAEFPAQIIAQLYRCRWQVEIAIKRLKTILDADLLRAHYGSPLADVWLNGKLLYVLMIERRAINKIKFDLYDDLTSTKVLTHWRIFKLIVDEISPIITLAMFWPREFTLDLRKALAERNRNRKLQSTPTNLVLKFDSADQISSSDLLVA